MNYTISELYNDIKKTLPHKKYIVCAQVSQAKLSNGNLYLSLKDDKSIIKSIIWKTKINNISINDGDKITVEGTLDIYSTYGTINFIIDKILENNGIGYLQLEYERIKNEFQSKGYFDKKLTIPKIIKKILILTSATGAAIHDFLFNLEKNKSNIEYIIKDVAVQGSDCPNSICKILDKYILDTDFDLIVISRGGGSYEDLFGFSNEKLIESVYNFKNTQKVPIISAIGHQIDNPLLDFVADKSCPTPSLASQFIIDHNKEYINNLVTYQNNIKNTLVQNLYNEQKKLNNYNNLLNNKFNELSNKLIEYKNNIYNELQNQKMKLKYFMDKLDSNTMYILDMENNKISSPEDLTCGDYFLIWNNSKFKITVEI